MNQESNWPFFTVIAPFVEIWSAIVRLWHDRTLRSGVCWCIILALAFLILSAIATKSAIAGDTIDTGISKWWLVPTFGLGLILGPILWTLGAWLRNRKDPWSLSGPNGAFPHLSREIKPNFFAWCFIALIISFFSVVAFLCWVGKLSGSCFREAIVNNPGGIFATLTGIGTLVGTYLAVQAVVEMKHTITSYSQLTARLTALIHEAGDSHEGVLFLSYSPLPGAWQVTKTMKNALKKALVNGRRRVEFVCLDSKDHLALLNRVASRGTREKRNVNTTEINDFQKECERLLEILNTKGDTDLGLPDPAPDAKQFNAEATRLIWGDMPGYYFFVSERRAIIVAPVGIPLPNDIQANQMKRITSATVETLGFETTDRQIIQLLRHEFRKYKRPCIESVYPSDTCEKCTYITRCKSISHESI